MAYTNAQRDKLESVIAAGEPVADEPSPKKQPAIPPNSQQTERVRLRSGKVVSRVVRPS